MEKNRIELYDGKAYGQEVSKYGLKEGYLDYLTLSKIVGSIVLNNSLIEHYPEYWEVHNGYESDSEVFQYYIISDAGAELLMNLTDELVFYNEEMDIYLWGITHFGTCWDYVLTDVRLI